MIAVLPTPASPISTGLFLTRLDNLCTWFFDHRIHLDRSFDYIVPSNHWIQCTQFGTLCNVDPLPPSHYYTARA
jgi:hypothetical protein